MRLRGFALALCTVALFAASLSAQPLSGTYSVGPGGAYPNLAAAIAALGSNGVAAPVVFFVTANDTGPWTLGPFPGQGPANPVLFDGGGTTVLGGTQPMLTLGGCANVTFRGFVGTFNGATNAFVVNAGTTDCVFTNCDFQAPPVTTGAALFNFVGGTGCRIEDSTFGGAYEALMSAVGNDTTTIQRCRVVGGGWRIMTLGGSTVTLVNNFITGGTNYGINGGIPGTTTSGANLKVWHNSVYIVHPTSGSQYCSLRWYSGAAGTEVRNNIFVDIYPTLTTSTFNLWCSGALRPAVMDYNCFFSNQAGYVPFFAGTNLTLAGWQALGFDLNSLQTDPLFISTTAVPVDLSISNLSPCVSAGTLIPTVTTDFFGLPRTVPISIGAHQGVAYNVLGVATTGPGIGDLNLSLTNITGAASEGFVLLSTDTTQPLGAGPFLGIRPDAVTWTVLGYPAVPGSPFHFPIGFPGLFPASPLVLPPGSLPGLSGVTLDAVALLLSPGFGYAGRSNVVRTTF